LPYNTRTLDQTSAENLTS